MSNIPYLSPRERVFGTLRNLQRLAQEGEDLNAKRAIILRALDRAISWESEIVSANWPTADRPFSDTAPSV
jgi:hypothetical protein